MTGSESHQSTPAEEEYLEAIYRLTGADAYVPLSSVAEYLSISPVSANEKVRRMEDKELVSYTPYVGVALTESGRKRAEVVLRRHRLWERMLADVLRVPWEHVHKEACRLEHATSELVERHLAELLEEPTTCPHGHPMPGGGAVSERGAILANLKAGQQAALVAVTMEDTDFLRALSESGLRLGAVIRVVESEPALQSMIIESGGKMIAMASRVAERIVVTTETIRDS